VHRATSAEWRSYGFVKTGRVQAMNPEEPGRLELEMVRALGAVPR
jgi:hypothetical protein